MKLNQINKSSGILEINKWINLIDDLPTHYQNTWRVNLLLALSTQATDHGRFNIEEWERTIEQLPEYLQSTWKFNLKGVKIKLV